MSERLKFFNQEYADYWSKKRSAYRLSTYDQALLEFIKPLKGRTLEVAIGSGKPFASMLTKQPFAECDISFPLLKEAKQQLSSRLVQSSAENMPFADRSFEAIYCFHSTWFFQDINKFLSECARILKPQGCLFFDILNAKNELIKKEYKQNLKQSTIPFFIFLKYAKNILKIILKKGTPIWQNIVPWIAAEAEQIKDLCEISFEISIYGSQKDETFTPIKGHETTFQKILFKAVKKNEFLSNL